MLKFTHSFQTRAALLPAIGLIGSMALWGSSFVAMKVAIQAFDPLLMVFGRMALASLVFLGCWKHFSSFTYVQGDWKYFLLMGLCEPCFYFIFESYALTYTSASQAGMITALLPLLVALTAGLFLKEKTQSTMILGFLIAIVGIMVMTTQSVTTENAPNPLLGNLLEFIAMCWAAGYMILARYLASRYSPFFLTACQMFIGTLFFLPVLLLPSTTLPVDWPLAPTLAVLYLGTIVSCGAYGLFNYGVSKLPASQASAYVNLIPVFSVLLGWGILHETLTMSQTLGMGMVLLGVWLSSSKSRRQQLEASSA